MLDEKKIQRNHEICLELLDKFIEVCEKNHIDYYLAFGSCLGSVRHKGFIPWDINIDILVTVQEYKKLDAAMKKEDLGNMRWCCPEGSGRVFPLLMRADSWEYGLRPNIDVSVYANAPNNKFLRNIVIKAAYFNIRMFKLKNTRVNRAFPYNILKCVASIFPNSMYIGFVHKLEKINRNKSTMYRMVLLPSVWGNQELMKTEWFGKEPVYGDFEGRRVRIIKNTHDYLTHCYGDYMKPKVWEDKGEYKHIRK